MTNIETGQKQDLHRFRGMLARVVPAPSISETSHLLQVLPNERFL